MSRLLINPGPTPVHPDVLAAQVHEMIPHRGEPFEEMFARVQQKLRQVFMTKNRVYVVTASGTGLGEAAMRNLLNDNEYLLSCINGPFSERQWETARANRKKATRLDFAWGTPVSPTQVASTLRQKKYAALALVHNDTGTSVTSPLEQIAEVVQDVSPDTLLIADCVTSAGAIKVAVDQWRVDFAYASSQKGLRTPPGLAFVAASDRAVEKARSVEFRGTYFDLLEYEKYLLKHQTPYTPAITLMWALEAALDRILSTGLENCFQRCAEMAAFAQNWATDRFGLYAQKGCRSNSVTSLLNPNKVPFKKLHDYLLARGIFLAGPYREGDLPEKTLCRLVHMGEITMNDIVRVTSTIDEFMS